MLNKTQVTKPSAATKFKTLFQHKLITSLLILSFSAIASADATPTEEPSSPPINQPSQIELPIITVHCGDLLTKSARIGNDLNCPEITESAIYVVGNHIFIDGRGHSISAPNARNGLFANGSEISITGFRVNGLVKGNGILAYDCPELSLFENNFSNNQNGIMLYAEHTKMKKVWVVDNEANHNSLFGIKTAFDGQGIIERPRITNNDFKNSGSYALSVEASSYEINFTEMNQMNFSKGGIFLQGGDFYLHDFTLVKEEIKNVQIFIANAHSVTVKNVDLSTNYSHQTSDEAIGLDLYRAQKFDIFRLKTAHNDVGLKLETEEQVPSSGRVRCSLFADNFTAGIMVSSYDQTPYGAILFDNDKFKEPPFSRNVFIQEGTVADPKFVSETDCNDHSF